MPNIKTKFRDAWILLKETFKEWNEDDPFRLSAVVAYYAIFSLPALMIIIISVAGEFLGQEAVQGEVSNQIGGMIGPDAAKSVEAMIASSYTSGNSTIATIIGIGTLLFGATGVFYQLQISLNIIWRVKVNPKEGIKKVLLDRATSLGVIIAIGFLLLISLLLTSVLSVFSNWITSVLPEYTIYLFYVLEFLLSFAIITVLFALIFKILPDVDIEWKTVWVGAAITAILFVIGKFALGIYFGKAEPGSAFGAAGSIILILLWVSYSCMILFFGAEFTKVYARKYKHNISPSSHAIRTPGYEKAVEEPKKVQSYR